MNNPNHDIHELVRSRREAEQKLAPVFLNRWSSRAYSNQPVRDEDLYTVLEAARWAPSARNDQPWRFIVAKTDEQLSLFHSFIMPMNLEWAQHAPVIVLLASQRNRESGEPNAYHTFDAGTAYGMLALQAEMLGLATHAIGGFDRAKAQEELGLPEDMEAHILITIGYRGDKEMLSAALQEREQPNTRRPLKEIVYEGTYQG